MIIVIPIIPKDMSIPMGVIVTGKQIGRAHV